MNEQRLWAPWRSAYVKGQEPALPAPSRLLPGADAGCFLCQAATCDDLRERLVVHRNGRSLTVLNRFPYNNGHLLVSPLGHKAHLAELSRDEHADLMATLTHAARLIERLMNAEGFNIGLNLGGAAGAGVPGHLHWHLVPRWPGDTNYMAATAATRVLPQALDELWELLSSHWNQADASTSEPRHDRS